MDQEKKPRKQFLPGNRRIHFNLLYLLIAILAVQTIHAYWVELQTVEVLPYSRFQKLLQERRIKEIVISQNEINGEFRAPYPDKKRYFTTVTVNPELAAMLEKYDVQFSQKTQSNVLTTILSWVVPAFAFFAIWMWLSRKLAASGGLGGGLMAIGKSKAKVYVQTDTRTTFKDVGGVDEAVEELKEVVDFLKNPQGYSRLGGRMPKGVLLVGPPGTGKTLLAKAVAGEANVPFFSINGSEFVEMFVGVGAARVRDLFEQARKSAPCIIFIDELDALGRARGTGPWMGGHDEKEQTLNQLLVELDGFDSRSGLILLAATNRPEVLDPALLRAGRFDRQILVDRPDRTGRLAILKLYLSHAVLDPGVDAESIAALTPGFTGADLANLVNEATLVATRRQRQSVTKEDFNEAIERIVAGLEKKNRLLNPKERSIVAHHEMGHAFVAAALPGCDPVHKVSIIPRGIAALGYTIQRPTEDRFLMTQEELENKMAVLLGGRAAETLVFRSISTGAHDDLGKATHIARNMAARYGMVPGLGQVTYDAEPTNFLGQAGPPAREFSEETAARIDHAVQEMINHAFQRAMSVLEKNKDLLEETAGILLSKETLTDSDLAPVFNRLVSQSETGRL
jgi:cell division protease FtsH